MAIYPKAEYRPLGKQTEDRMSAHNIICIHTMVGHLLGTDDYFREGGYYGTEAHFGVGNTTDGANDGKVIQWQDTEYCADANLEGKPEVLSIETADGGNPNNPWSAKAKESIIELIVWLCRRYNIPAKLIPDTKPGRRGLAYHRQGCDHSSSYRPKGWPYDMWRVPGGRKWSISLGKTCPGDVRIKQFVDEVIPEVQKRLSGGGGAAPSTPDYARRYARLEESVQFEPGAVMMVKDIPEGAKKVILNVPTGVIKDARIQWVGPKYPTVNNVFPKDGLPSADWITMDWTHDEIHRLRRAVATIPKGKDKGVEADAVCFRVMFFWDPGNSFYDKDTPYRQYGSLDFEF